MVQNQTTANSMNRDYDELINTLFLISELAKKLILKIVKLSLIEMEDKNNERIKSNCHSSK